MKHLSQPEHPLLKDAIKDFSIKNKPYTIQEDFMNDVLHCYDSNSIGFFESPTGTGKSMSVLCASIAYLRKHENDFKKSFLSDSDDDDFDFEDEPGHASKKMKLIIATRTHSQIKEMVGELKKLKECAKDLLEKNNKKRMELLRKTKNMGKNEKQKYLSEINSCNADIEFYKEYLDKFPKVVSLASRKQLCVNQEFTKLSNAELNEQCNTKCQFYNDGNFDNFVSRIKEEPLDIEDLVKYGSSHLCCPYFSTRNSINNSQIILLPYQTLFQSETRKALKLSISNSCIIIDEAHNLVDSLNSMYTTVLNMEDIIAVYSKLIQYRKVKSIRNNNKKEQDAKEKYEDEEKENEKKMAFNNASLLIKFSLSLLKVLKNIPSSEVIKMNEFQLKYKIDVGNMFSLIQWVKDVQLIYYLSHNDKSLTNEERAKLIESLHKFFVFIESMGNLDDQGCVLIDSDKENFTYLLLNPSTVFADVSNKAKSIILVGGTLRPFEDAIVQLVSKDNLKSNNIITHSNEHIIPKENCLVMCAKTGPSNQKLLFTHERRSSIEMMRSIGDAVLQLSAKIPNGMIVFFTSFEYMISVYNFLKKENYIEQIQQNKFLLCETKETNKLDMLMNTYKSHIKNSDGAIMFAVINGKLSEGINFADKFCRCVMIVGMPFSDKNDLVLQQRMHFFDYMKSNKLSVCDGKQFYENICMRAVNQSIGRSFRNINDYASVVLFDERYEKHSQQLPSWIQRSFSVCNTWNTIIQKIDTFFSLKEQ